MFIRHGDNNLLDVVIGSGNTSDGEGGSGFDHSRRDEIIQGDFFNIKNVIRCDKPCHFRLGEFFGVAADLIAPVAVNHPYAFVDTVVPFDDADMIGVVIGTVDHQIADLRDIPAASLMIYTAGIKAIRPPGVGQNRGGNICLPRTPGNEIAAPLCVWIAKVLSVFIIIVAAFVIAYLRLGNADEIGRLVAGVGIGVFKISQHRRDRQAKDRQ